MRSATTGPSDCTMAPVCNPGWRCAAGYRVEIKLEVAHAECVPVRSQNGMRCRRKCGCVRCDVRLGCLLELLEVLALAACGELRWEPQARRQRRANQARTTLHTTHLLERPSRMPHGPTAAGAEASISLACARRFPSNDKTASSQVRLHPSVTEGNCAVGCMISLIPGSVLLPRWVESPKGVR